MQRQHQANGAQQLRQLSRRFLLLLAGGLRDSRLLDHWARAVLLAGRCTGAGERGGERKDEGERAASEEPAADRDLNVVVGPHQQHQDLGGRAAGIATPAAYRAFYSFEALSQVMCVYGKALLCTVTGQAGLGSSLPPGICAALRAALSGPCTQHLTLALGTLMLHQADGGSLYGMPLPYRTGALAAAVVGASPTLAQPPRQDLYLVDGQLFNAKQWLVSSAHGMPPPPHVHRWSHLDLLLRMGRLAVRSAQAYRGQEGAMGQRVHVLTEQVTGDVALAALRGGRALLSPLQQQQQQQPSGQAEPAAAMAAGGTGSSAPAPPTAAVSSSGSHPLSTRAAVAAETRWHRLLLDTGLWVELRAELLSMWVDAWQSAGNELGSLPPAAGEALRLCGTCSVCGCGNGICTISDRQTHRKLPLTARFPEKETLRHSDAAA